MTEDQLQKLLDADYAKQQKAPAVVRSADTNDAYNKAWRDFIAATKVLQQLIEHDGGTLKINVSLKAGKKPK